VRVLAGGDGIARQLVGPRDRHELAAPGPIDQPRFGGGIVRDGGDRAAAGGVRLRHRAGVTELEQPASPGADRRSDLLQRRADCGGEAIERDARQLPRQRQRQLRQLFLIDHQCPRGRNIDDCHGYLTTRGEQFLCPGIRRGPALIDAVRSHFHGVTPGFRRRSPV
jgi:hypothetical protein